MIKKITVILNFLKKYLFGYFVPFKVTPLRYYILMRAFFPILDTCWNTLFSIVHSSCFDFFSHVTICFPFIDMFSFGKRNKWAEAKSSEYSGWGMITVLVLDKNSHPNIGVRASILLWSKIHDLFFYNLLRFWRISARNWLLTSR